MKKLALQRLLSLLVVLPAAFTFAAQDIAHAEITKLTSTIACKESLVLHDQTRNKDLSVRVTYPSDQKTFPVIVFSHGAGGSKDAYQYLARYWAEHGYVVIQPTHYDSLGNVKSRREAFRKLLKTIRALPTDYKGWNDRMHDVSFVIDSLPEIDRQIEAQLDDRKIGLGGHSYGAFTAVIKGGGTVPKAAAQILGDATDKRISAIMPISPQGVKRRARDFGFDDAAAWKNISIPAMYMTGTLDETGWTKLSDREAAFNGSPPGDKYFVVINGANHMTFAGRPISDRVASRLSHMFGPNEKGNHEKMLQSVQQVSTEFWDAYLKGDPAARKKLLVEESSEVHIDRK